MLALWCNMHIHLYKPEYGTADIPLYVLHLELWLQAMLNRAVQLLSKDPALASKGLSINAVDPGWCRTRMGGSQAPKTPEEGAKSVFWAVVNGGPEVTGGFFAWGTPQPW